jgi:sucrose phosphorylase
MAGLPAVYIHSLLGSRNDAEGVRQTGRARTINRERLSYQDVKDALCNPVTRRARIFDGYSRLILARRGERAFHPNAGQQVMDLPSSIFGVRRQSQDGSQTIMALHNVTSKEHSIRISSLSSNRKFFDCLQREMIDSVDTVVLSPFTSMWLREED